MTLDAFPDSNNSEITVLGFDFGTQRIGVAFGQSISNTTRALPILAAREGIPDWNQVEQLIATWQPDLLVVGLPYRSDGSEGELVKRARKFANRLHGRFHLPCYGIDEFLSSRAAEELMGNRDQPVDSVAAQLILESWLTEYESRRQRSAD